MARNFKFERTPIRTLTDLMLRLQEGEPVPRKGKPKAETVECGACGKVQPDKGMRATCEKCGISPIPSREYPPGHVFHWQGDMTDYDRWHRQYIGAVPPEEGSPPE